MRRRAWFALESDYDMVLSLFGVNIICIRRKTRWAPLFKWHDYLCLVLYLPLFALAPLRSRYSATVFLSSVALHSLAIGHSIDSSGFLYSIWERSATLAQHGSESLKTDPLKFFRRFFQLVVAVMVVVVVVIRRAPWSGIAFTYMHMRIVETPLPFAYRIHSHRGIFPRGPSYFYHMVFHHRCAFCTDIAETSYRDSRFCPRRR